MFFFPCGVEWCGVSVNGAFNAQIQFECERMFQKHLRMRSLLFNARCVHQVPFLIDAIISDLMTTKMSVGITQRYYRN